MKNTRKKRSQAYFVGATGLRESADPREPLRPEESILVAALAAGERRPDAYREATGHYFLSDREASARALAMMRIPRVTVALRAAGVRVRARNQKKKRS